MFDVSELKVTPAEIDWGNLVETAEELQSKYSRGSNEYKRIIAGLREKLNRLEKGTLASLDVHDIENQVSHLFYFKLKNLKLPVPFDIASLHELVSHLKNPVVLKLRQISPCLIPAHYKIISKLTEEQERERELSLSNLNINTATKKVRAEMQFDIAQSKVAEATTRKLDYLASALRIPANLRFDLKLLQSIIMDETHLRQRKALAWLKDSVYMGNRTVFNATINQALQVLEKECASVLREMEVVSGVPFTKDMDELEPGFNWHCLSTALQRRGEGFVKSFNYGDRINKKIEVMTFPMVRNHWEAENYRNRMHANQPTEKMGLQESCAKLTALYFEIEKCIEESTKVDGEVETAIKTDRRLGQLDEQAEREAREWAVENKAKLHALKFEVLDMLAKALKNVPKPLLSGNMEQELAAYLASKTSKEEAGPTSRLWTRALKNLELLLERLLERINNPNAKLLRELNKVRQKIIKNKRLLTNMDMLGSVRQSCATFKEFEEKLVDFNTMEEAFDRLRIRCEGAIVTCYRAAHFGVEFNEDEEDEIDPVLRSSIDWLERSHFKETFGVVLDDVLINMKELNYKVISADRYRGYFDQAMKQDNQECLFLLERLLHEIHSLPRLDQMLHALNSCKDMLDAEALQRKLTFVIDNDFKLQDLINEVQAELRERITKVRIRPRRLRFEVFSLADCYADSLGDLLDGLLRMAPTIASDEEGERLGKSILAIESQVIEAQKVTKQKGEAFEKLSRLAQQHLFPKDLVARLRKDLRENFDLLNNLLVASNEGLKTVKEIQNRFGGHHQLEHLNHVINIYDLEKLKETYNFLENITMMDLKRFAMIYRHKDAILDELFSSSDSEVAKIHPDINEHLTPPNLKRYRESKTIPIPLKTALLIHDHHMLEAEVQLLIYTLNFVLPEHVSKKAVYISILGVLNQVKENPEIRVEVSRVWYHFMDKLEEFQPPNYKMNYANNKERLFNKANPFAERYLKKATS